MNADKKIENKTINVIVSKDLKYTPNSFIIGTPGCGRAFHPWDNLFNCPRCDSRRVWMENENGTYDDMNQPVRIRCMLCGNKTKYGELLEVRSIWSNGKDTWRNANIVYPISKEQKEDTNLFIKLLKFISDFI